MLSKVILADAQQLQLLLIALLAAVVGDILLPLLLEPGLVLLRQRYIVLLGPLPQQGIELHRLHGVGLGIGAVGHAVGHLGTEIQIRHIGGQVLAVIGQPVQVLLRRDILTVDAHQHGVRMDAGDLVVKTVRSLAGAHPVAGGDPTDAISTETTSIAAKRFIG